MDDGNHLVYSVPRAGMRRRNFIGGISWGVVTSFSGCTAVGNTGSKEDNNNFATLERILIRSDTGEVEPVELTLVYASRNNSTERPVWGSFEAPSSEEKAITDFDGKSGIYSLTARSLNYCNIEVSSFNSYGGAVGPVPLQFEVVIQRSGDIWTNINEEGADISIPS